MKAVILAGGLGTRISEESSIKPKPMIDVGGQPILWHILKSYSSHGINDFIICLGYKGYVIKEYFANYFLHMSDVTFDLAENRIEVHQRNAEPWKVTLVDTGEQTMTGGRIRRIRPYVAEEDAFCLTYGDGLSDVNISDLIKFHQNGKRLCTLTAVQPPGRFGSFALDGLNVTAFQEKPQGDGSWINGGFFVCSPKVCDYIIDDSTVWEREPMEKLALAKQMGAFQHGGFWQPMDTMRDKVHLEALWQSGNAPWKTW
jgi:glucose-1-phosphate cytidylyltransferase